MNEIRNMGARDRGLRGFVVAPLAIIAAFAFGAGTVVGIVLFVIAGIMFATAVTGFCPNYIWLGISTDHGVHRVGHSIRHGHA
jgi:hypothetical protein